MPLWAQLQQELTRRLATGAFDQAFPTETELTQTYAVSRHTVREALRRLRETGVLDSARGRGTYVHREIEQPLGSLYSLFRSVTEHGMRPSSRVLALRRQRDPEAAAALGIASDAELVYLERVRLTDDEPLAHDRAWLPASLAEPLLAADFDHSGLYDELATRCGIRPTGGRERITAVTPPERTRELLRLPDRQPCLRVERTGMADDRVIEHRITLVRGDRYTVIADWSAHGYAVSADTP
jgi:GntR family transcriptional regulator